MCVSTGMHMQSRSGKTQCELVLLLLEAQSLQMKRKYIYKDNRIDLAKKEKDKTSYHGLSCDQNILYEI